MVVDPFAECVEAGRCIGCDGHAVTFMSSHLEWFPVRWRMGGQAGGSSLSVAGTAAASKSAAEVERTRCHACQRNHVERKAPTTVLATKSLAVSVRACTWGSLNSRWYRAIQRGMAPRVMETAMRAKKVAAQRPPL